MSSLKVLVFRLIALLLLIGLAVFTACEPSVTITEDIQPCDSTSIVISGKVVPLDAGISGGDIPFEIQVINDPGMLAPITKVVKARATSAADSTFTTCITQRLDESRYTLVPPAPATSGVSCLEQDIDLEGVRPGDTVVHTVYVRSAVACELALAHPADLPLIKYAYMDITWTAQGGPQDAGEYRGTARISRDRGKRSATVYLPAGTTVKE
jgi:hypothetical protein